MIEAMDHAAEAILRYLATASVVAAVLPLAAWLVVRTSRMRAAIHRHMVWFYCLVAIALLPPLWLYAPKVKLAVLPVRAEPLPAPVSALEPARVEMPEAFEYPPIEPAGAPLAVSTAALPAPVTAAEHAFPWRPLLAACWLLGLAVMLARLPLGYIGLRRLLRRAVPVGPEHAANGLTELKAPVLVSDDLDSPVVLGVFRPAILLPRAIVDGGNHEELRMALDHELAHLERRDHVVNAFQRLLEAPLFFHPLVWYASRRLTQEREQVCDNWVLGQGTEARRYARLLAGLAETGLRRQHGLQGVALFEGGLLERIQTMLDPRSVKVTRSSAIVSFAAALLAVSALTVFGTVTLGEAPVESEGVVLAPAPEPGPYSVNLPGGGAVALVGLSYHPSQGKPWWRPDGTAIEDPTWQLEEHEVLLGKPEEARRLLLRVSTAGGPDPAVGVDLNGHPCPGGFPAEVYGKATRKWRWFAAGSTDGAPSRLRVKVASGEYAPVPAAMTANSNRFSMMCALDDMSFVAGQLREAGRKCETTLSVQWEGLYPHRQYRLRARDRAGRWHESRRTAGLSARGLAQETHRFDVRLDRVREVVLETRPFIEVEFGNVSLQPGQKTSVAIAVQGRDRTPAPEELTFGPVIERVVNDDGVGEDLFIDLDTGKLFSPSDLGDARDDTAIFAALRRLGVDASCETGGRAGGLTGIDMVCVPWRSAEWDTFPPDRFRTDDMLAFGEPGFPVFMNARGELPATFAFKTREGGEGLLQILEFHDESPRGVKIRYKMVQQGARGPAVEEGAATATRP